MCSCLQLYSKQIVFSIIDIKGCFRTWTVCLMRRFSKETIRHVKFSGQGLLSTGTFQYLDIFEWVPFGAGTFPNWNISAHGYFVKIDAQAPKCLSENVHIALHGAKICQCQNVYVPKYPCSKILQCHNNPIPKCLRTEISRCQKVSMPKQPQRQNIHVPERPHSRKVPISKCSCDETSVLKYL